MERDFGRFARVVRLNGAFDVERASATLRAGELTVVLPKRIDRRGQAHRVPVRLPADHPRMIMLFIGDIIGRPGRELLRKGLAALVEHHDVDFVIANAENSAAGFGITKDIGDTMLDYGVDVMTSGNHIWDKKEAHRLHRHRAAPAAARQLPRRRAGPRLAVSPRRATAGRSASST